MFQQLLFDLVRRQDDPNAGTTTDGTTENLASCQADDVADDLASLRIASVFVILVASLMGAVLPVWLSRYQRSKSKRISRMAFFVTKYSGSGVIVGTAFMHLISPANEILAMECLQPMLGGYDWAMGIVLIMVMFMFFVELLASWFEDRQDAAVCDGHRPQSHAPSGDIETESGGSVKSSSSSTPSCPPQVEDHLGHRKEHAEGGGHAAYGGKITSIVILEAGVVLHSVFVGLTLAVSSEFVILFVVLAFHQTFEGLGLGSRLATFDWPKSGWRRFTPWVFSVLYGLTTPVAIAAGLGVKSGLGHNPTTRFLVEGISSAISGGILLYTGLVELMAHEFMFSGEMDRRSIKTKMFAFACMALGAGLMALLAKWA